MSSANGTVRLVQEAELPFIRDWLELEARGNEGFIHNWSLIEDAAADGEMTVFSGDGGAVGFLTHGLTRGSILQVRSDSKGGGIGRRLVEHAIAEADAAGNTILVIQCEPKSSIPFWRRMGFVAHRERLQGGHRANVYMHRVSGMEHESVRGDDLHRVMVRVYPKGRLYRDGEHVIPDQVHFAAARLTGDRTLHLDHRISIVDESVLQDAVIEVDVWGSVWFLDKAKREAARELGFRATPNHCGWYVDTLQIPEAPVESFAAR